MAITDVSVQGLKTEHKHIMTLIARNINRELYSTPTLYKEDTGDRFELS